MDLDRFPSRAVGRFLVLLLVAVVLQSLSPAEAGSKPPKDFPRAVFIGGSVVEGETRQKGVLLHAGWINDEGGHERWFRQATLFPWPKPIKVTGSSFRIRLEGVRYPGRLEVGVFRGTGLNDSPSGGRKIYICPTTPTSDAKCRWIPNVEDGRPVWDVQVDHAQDKGHLYVVIVGTWDEPEDPPKPVGSREQVGTWIFHARLRPSA
jgi:hypothetical protein